MQSNKFYRNNSNTFLVSWTLLFLVALLLFNGCAAARIVSSGTKAVSAGTKVVKVIPRVISPATNIPKIQSVKNITNLTNNSKKEVPILMNIPGNSDEYKNLYGISPTTSQMTSVNNVNRKIYIDRNKVKKLDNLNNLMEQVKNAQSKYVIIVGHNDEGKFIFVNGDYIEIAALQNNISNSNKIPIFLSCKSQRYSSDVIGIADDITYDEAYETARKLSAYLEENSANWKNLSSEEIVEKLKDLRFDHKLNFRIKNKVILVTFAAISTTEDRHNRKNRKSRR